VVLIAEAYWNMEWTLQQQGFAFCYDKRLYDRIVETDAPKSATTYRPTGLPVRSDAVPGKPRRTTNSRGLPDDAERAAAVAIATLPGATLWHEGQFEGRRVRRRCS